ncbi:MAG: hypothetical protein DIJKHBIC_02997 [Thermoanaerobaculia bacterium]|nr:hypothetical protein [Thermoanaerobaculia bacterium]
MTRRAVLSSSFLAAFFLSCGLPLLGQRFPEKDLPPVLKPWVPWVLDEKKDAVCPAVDGSAVCLWPGQLDLTVGGSGGTFSFEVHLDRPLFVPLPGDEKVWPQDVKAAGAAVPVVARDGHPAVSLPAGDHRIEGRLIWKELPDSLQVPQQVALVGLSIGAKKIGFPRREENGLLLLREASDGEVSADDIRLKVFRRLSDGVPMSVETRIEFEVSGKAREVRLDGVTLPTGVPVSVGGDLPARLDKGILLVQVRSGRFKITVLERIDGPVTSFKRKPSQEPWPFEEVWLFSPNEDIRQIELSGANAVDPVRAEVPGEWQKLAAFQMTLESELQVKETRRGKPEAAPDQVALSRAYWLDLDGKNFTIRDTFKGSLGRTSRFNAIPPTELGRASSDGADQLITLDPSGGARGFEVRRTAVSIETDSRLPRSGRIPAVGWSVNVQSLSATLYLPPGWTLIAAPGVDRVPGGWFGRFTLFSFFVVLLITIATAKLFGPKWGGVALLTLVVCHGEPGAPEFIWLSLLGALALLGLVPAGKARVGVQIWWWLSAIVLAVIAIPFFIKQIRVGLFPQAGPAWVSSARGGGGFLGGMAKDAAPPPPSSAPESPAMEEQAPAPQDMVASAPDQKARQEVQARKPVAKKKAYTSYDAYQQDPHSVIQTGTGVPNWSWRAESLQWTGPVSSDHTMRLVLLSPAANLLLALVRVLLVALFAARLLNDDRTRPLWKRSGAPLPGAPVLASVAFVFLVAAPARAETPPVPNVNQQESNAAPNQEVTIPAPGSWVLDEMRDRLTRDPECAPECTSTAWAVLSLKGGTLTLEFEVHAAVAAGWPIPGPANSWVPARVSLAGKPSGALVRGENGFLFLRVPQGVHRVTVEGPLPPRDSLVLQFASKPRRIQGSADGWQVDGIREDGTTEGSVQLTRKLEQAGSTAIQGGGLYEPWLEVVRVLDIGVTWKVTTIVRRISPAGAPVLVKVPVLPGMLITDSDRPVKDGEIEVSLGRDDLETQVNASLEIGDKPVILKAAEGKSFSEIWTLRCGNVWQCEVKGSVPPVEHQRDGYLSREYRPWPGESVEVHFRKPAGAPGQALTIDEASLNVVPGIRLQDAILTFRVRSSRAGPLVVTLPEGADVRSVKANGSDRAVRPEGQKLTLSVAPGSQSFEIMWRQQGGMSLFYRSPAVAIGSSAVNASLDVTIPPDRWLLYARGPKWGPAILFWGYLLFVSLAALMLGKVKASPLSSLEWFVLGLGMAQLPAPVLLIVAGWFLALGWRRQRTDLKPALFDLRQLLLLGWTLVFFGCLYGAVHQGLLLRPDMQVAGNQSSETLLKWYADRIDGTMPRAWVASAPMWMYRILMLAWALWLAIRLIRWLGWAWESWTEGGSWKRLRPLPPPADEKPAKAVPHVATPHTAAPHIAAPPPPPPPAPSAPPPPPPPKPETEDDPFGS